MPTWREIVNHYVLAAIGNQIDLNDQLEYILGELEANKKAIIEDIRMAHKKKAGQLPPLVVGPVEISL